MIKKTLLITTIIVATLAACRPAPSTTNSAGPLPTESEAGDAQALTPENASDIRQIARLGRGVVEEIHWSPDGNQLAALTTQGLWVNDMSTEAAPRLVETSSPIRALAYNAEGTAVALGLVSGEVQLWDGEFNAMTVSFPAHTGEVRSVAFSPSGDELTTGGQDGFVVVWETDNGNEVARFRGHTDWVEQVTFDEGGNAVLSVGRDNNFYVRQVDDGVVLSYGTSEVGTANTATFQGTQGLVLVARPDFALRLVDASTRSGTFVFTEHENTISALATRADGQQFASGDVDGFIQIWDADMNPTSTLQTPGGISTMAFSPNGLALAVYSRDGTLRVYRLPDDDEVLLIAGHSGAVNDLAFNPTNDVLITADEDNFVHLWQVDLEAGAEGEIAIFGGHTSPVRKLDVSDDGQFIVTGAADGTVRVWETISGNTLRAFEAHTNDVLDVRFGSGALVLATVGYRENAVKLWNVRTGELVESVTSGVQTPSNLAFDAEQRNIIWSGGIVIHSLDISETTMRNVFLGARGIITTMVVNDTTIVAAEESGSVRTWDIETGDTQVLGTHPSAVSALAFNSTGTLLASTDVTGEFRLWDLANRTEVRRIDTQSPMNAVAFDPKDRFVATASELGVVWLWGLQ